MLPFESLEAAQAAVDGWVHAHNHQRPRQALEMAVPASQFRRNGPAREAAVPQPTAQDDQLALLWAQDGPSRRRPGRCPAAPLLSSRRGYRRAAR